jgi:hypothetical protein
MLAHSKAQWNWGRTLLSCSLSDQLVCVPDFAQSGGIVMTAADPSRKLGRSACGPTAFAYRSLYEISKASLIRRAPRWDLVDSDATWGGSNRSFRLQDGGDPGRRSRRSKHRRPIHSGVLAVGNGDMGNGDIHYFPGPLLYWSEPLRRDCLRWGGRCCWAGVLSGPPAPSLLNSIDLAARSPFHASTTPPLPKTPPCQTKASPPLTP